MRFRLPFPRPSAAAAACALFAAWGSALLPLHAKTPLPSSPSMVEELDCDLDKTPSPEEADSPDRGRRSAAAAAFATAQELEKEEKYNDALTMLDKAEQAIPGYPPVTVRKALIYFRQGRTADAMELLKAYNDSHPANPEILTLLAHGYSEEGDWKKASATAQSAIKYKPSLLSNYRIILRSCEIERREKDIIPLLQQASKNQGDSALYYLRLAKLWNEFAPMDTPATREAALKQTSPLYEKALTLAPDNALIAYQVAELAFDQSDYKHAAAGYEIALDRNPTISTLRERLVVCYISNGEPAKAINLLEDLVVEFPERKNLYLMLGDLYAQSEDWKKAAENYQLYIRLGNPTADDYLKLVEAMLNSGQREGALAATQSASEKFPLMPQMAHLRGVIFLEMNQYEEALSSLEQAEARTEPNGKWQPNSLFYYQKAIVYERLGQMDKAEETFRKSIKLDPENHTALNYLGYMWAEHGQNLTEAEGLLKRALKLVPDDPAYLDSMGWILYQKGQYQKALPYLEKALAKMPDDPEVNDHMGDLQLKLGAVAKAIEYWTKASSKDSTRAGLADKINRYQGANAQIPK